MPAPPRKHAPEILEAARCLTGALGLRGLNGIDFIIGRKSWKLLELNPRPTATLGLWDVDPLPPLFALHRKACEGHLPTSLPRIDGCLASAVVYARETVRIPRAFQWPDWCADLPAPGSLIEAHTPLCSVLAAGEDTDCASFWADEMRQSILRRLSARASVATPMPAGTFATCSL